jgi:fatty acid/phospholipid biosynthesis enzyme
VCIVAHGQSSARAIHNAINVAEAMIGVNVSVAIDDALTNGSKMPPESA